jgi:hypothetical protein
MHDSQYKLASSPFKDCKSFDDLFEEVAECPNLSHDNHTPEPEGWSVPLINPPKEDTAIIKCSLRITGQRRGWMFAKPKPEVIDFLRGRMLNVEYDHFTFEAVIREGGEALITCKYGQILGSVWLALVDASTVPVDPHHG